MTYYRELGFVNTSAMLREAYEGGYAVGAFNFVCLEQLQAIVMACIESQAPFILQASANVKKYTHPLMVRYMAQACREIIQEAGSSIPLALHLDHGLSYEDCVESIQQGFSSVMIDGSALPYEENIALTAKVVAYAHQYDVSAEGELGVLSGIEEGIIHASSRYTSPEQAVDFVERTGVDSLAVSVGTSHGINKTSGASIPSLRLDILEEIARQLPGFPLVLHGASTIAPQYVEMINTYGGKLENVQGMPEDQIMQASRSAVCKVNIASDGWVAMTAVIRKALAENPEIVDPRKYLALAREEMKQQYIRKNTVVLGSAGKA
jgi:fructose-bisphosphate aldolase class II